MQIPQPLAVLHVGLAARHVFDVPGIDQTDGDARFLQHLGQGDPIYPGRLHREGVDPALAQPRDQGAQLIGEGAETTHRGDVPVRWHRHVDLARADVGARRVGLQGRERALGGAARLGFGFAHGKTAGRPRTHKGIIRQTLKRDTLRERAFTKGRRARAGTTLDYGLGGAPRESRCQLASGGSSRSSTPSHLRNPSFFHARPGNAREPRLTFDKTFPACGSSH